ncbi:endonuclease [Tenacibaculum holothuriorum]|uniref:endonuclease n=1 Tax=Tenacibaculum holothuriorum TaxID=1635173 RepID=UPI000A3219ED|nr:endonuclease [Tenacibaculum holothuriorum]
MMKKLPLLIFLASFSLFAQQSYYNDVDLTKSGTALRDELATKIINTHTKVLSYGWEADQATDVDPNDASKVFLIYGWEDGSDSDCTNDLKRGINDNGGSSCDWNREHVYPKSLGTPSFSNNTTPGADGHHIRASDVQRNNSRGNLLFTNGSGNSKSVSGGWYPGDEWCGDVARIIMYMYLRYGNQCLPKNVGTGATNSVDSNMMNLFLEWNAADPVSATEDQRNNYLENSSNTYGQGNRNPFIDNPNLATQIWGGPTAENRWATASTEENVLLSSIAIFPNPSTTRSINIRTPNSSLSIINITLYSVIGKKVFSTNKPVFDNNLLTIESLNSGIYLLKISSKNSSTTKKIIIQ